jgi:hypothetical protein
MLDTPLIHPPISGLVKALRRRPVDGLPQGRTERCLRAELRRVERRLQAKLRRAEQRLQAEWALMTAPERLDPDVPGSQLGRAEAALNRMAGW